MTKSTSFIAFAGVILFCSCSGKPSEKDISKKLLLEYICNDKAIVNNLKILKTEETKSTFGGHIVLYTVTGEVEWPEGCTEFGTNTPKGTREKFEKRVSLFKNEQGEWQ